jgi:hypothetical protein
MSIQSFSLEEDLPCCTPDTDQKVPCRVKQRTFLRIGDTMCLVGGMLNSAKLQGLYVGF